MASTQDIFALVGKRMRRSARAAGSDWTGNADLPPIADLIGRIDRALIDRRAA